MTTDEFHLAAVKDARDAYAAFQSMRTDELWRLLQAHTADQQTASTPEAIAFGAGRLALIAEVLSGRGEPARGFRIPSVKRRA
jgi:hypothetical protein